VQGNRWRDDGRAGSCPLLVATGGDPSTDAGHPMHSGGQFGQFDQVRTSCDPQDWIMAPEPERSYPSELPVLALRQTVVFPLTLQPLAINRPVSIESVNRALAGDRLLFLAFQQSDRDEPEPDDLRRIGTIAAIRQMAKVPTGGMHIIVEGLTRARAETITRADQALRARVAPLPETFARTLEVDA